MVMPRSRSRSMESSTCSCISRASRPPQVWIRRSASVDLPWSTCAMIEKWRICCCSGGKRDALAGPAPGEIAIIPAGGDRPGSTSREAADLAGIESAVADDAAVASQHRHLESEAPARRRVVVDVLQLERRHDRRQFRDEVVAELAVLTRVDDDPVTRDPRAVSRGGPPRRAPRRAQPPRGAG